MKRSHNLPLHRSVSFPDSFGYQQTIIRSETAPSVKHGMHSYGFTTLAILCHATLHDPESIAANSGLLFRCKPLYAFHLRGRLISIMSLDVRVKTQGGHLIAYRVRDPCPSVIRGPGSQVMKPPSQILYKEPPCPTGGNAHPTMSAAVIHHAVICTAWQGSRNARPRTNCWLPRQKCSSAAHLLKVASFSPGGATVRTHFTVPAPGVRARRRRFTSSRFRRRRRPWDKHSSRRKWPAYPSSLSPRVQNGTRVVSGKPLPMRRDARAASLGPQIQYVGGELRRGRVANGRVRVSGGGEPVILDLSDVPSDDQTGARLPLQLPLPVRADIPCL
ncbi:hypothetical protein C8Q77DRAFT_582931 [Trametes polyzona]|nr:hypothetical protein C8Q77DRAFT_582931 [Trametes polyzona]